MENEVFCAGKSRGQGFLPFLHAALFCSETASRLCLNDVPSHSLKVLIASFLHNYTD